MLALGHDKSRGDTLIEVLFAIAIFSSVAVSSLSIMNQGASISQRALEITLVRQEMDSQAETLRYLNAAYVAAYQPGTASASYTDAAGEWIKINNVVGTSTAISSLSVGTSCPDPSSPDPSQHIPSFVVNSHKATLLRLTTANSSKAQTFSQIGYNISNDISSVNGIWIEAIHSPTSTNAYQANAGYIDFHIRACWDSPGQSVPMTLGTIVRLYEPLTDVSGISTPAPVITSTPTPAAPVVSVSAAGNEITWSWPAVDCGTKTTQYQYRYSYDGTSPFTSDWLATNGTSITSTDIGITTLDQGITYNLDVQAECYSNTTISNWSVTGTKGYTVPPPAPRTASWDTPGIYTWTPPSGITQVTVLITSATGGAGGGGGGIGQSGTINGHITFPSGGAGNNGTAGGVTSFGSYLSSSATGYGYGGGGSSTSGGAVIFGTGGTGYVNGAGPVAGNNTLARGGNIGGGDAGYGNDTYGYGYAGCGGGGGGHWPAIQTSQVVTITAGAPVTVTIGAGGGGGAGGAGGAGTSYLGQAGTAGADGTSGNIAISW